MTRRAIPAVLVGLLVPMALAVSCKEDSPPPPLPSADPQPTASTPVTLEVEDAGEPDADEGGKPGPSGPAPKRASLQACCSALLQNSKSAPAPANTYYAQAAATCSAAVAAGKDQPGVLSAIRGALRGQKMPAGCL